jgi:hypothetical protein
MERRCVLGLVAAGAMGGAQALQAVPKQAQGDCSQSHTEWVAQALKRMQTIETGMTRKTLLTVFTTEGGISTALQRTYVSRDCPYFKVNVEFKAVRRTDRDKDDRAWMEEKDDDILLKISRPYLQFSIAD